MLRFIHLELLAILYHFLCDDGEDTFVLGSATAPDADLDTPDKIKALLEMWKPWGLVEWEEAANGEISIGIANEVVDLLIYFSGMTTWGKSLPIHRLCMAFSRMSPGCHDFRSKTAIDLRPNSPEIFGFKGSEAEAVVDFVQKSLGSREPGSLIRDATRTRACFCEDPFAFLPTGDESVIDEVRLAGALKKLKINTPSVTALVLSKKTEKLTTTKPLAPPSAPPSEPPLDVEGLPKYLLHLIQLFNLLEAEVGPRYEVTVEKASNLLGLSHLNLGPEFSIWNKRGLAQVYKNNSSTRGRPNVSHICFLKSPEVLVSEYRFVKPKKATRTRSSRKRDPIFEARLLRMYEVTGGRPFEGGDEKVRRVTGYQHGSQFSRLVKEVEKKGWFKVEKRGRHLGLIHWNLENIPFLPNEPDPAVPSRPAVPKSPAPAPASTLDIEELPQYLSRFIVLFAHFGADVGKKYEATVGQIGRILGISKAVVRTSIFMVYGQKGWLETHKEGKGSRGEPTISHITFLKTSEDVILEYHSTQTKKPKRAEPPRRGGSPISKKTVERLRGLYELTKGKPFRIDADVTRAMGYAVGSTSAFGIIKSGEEMGWFTVERDGTRIRSVVWNLEKIPFLSNEPDPPDPAKPSIPEPPTVPTASTLDTSEPEAVSEGLEGASAQEEVVVDTQVAEELVELLSVPTSEKREGADAEEEEVVEIKASLPVQVANRIIVPAKVAAVLDASLYAFEALYEANFDNTDEQKRIALVIKLIMDCRVATTARLKNKWQGK